MVRVTVYMAAHSQMNYGMNDVYYNSDISHLCYNSRVVQQHIFPENLVKYFSNHRKKCKEECKCYGGLGDYPSCIFTESYTN